jgi:hypothetical protein
VTLLRLPSVWRQEFNPRPGHDIVCSTTSKAANFLPEDGNRESFRNKVNITILIYLFNFYVGVDMSKQAIIIQFNSLFLRANLTDTGANYRVSTRR